MSEIPSKIYILYIFRSYDENYIFLFKKDICHCKKTFWYRNFQIYSVETIKIYKVHVYNVDIMADNIWVMRTKSHCTMPEIFIKQFYGPSWTWVWLKYWWITSGKIVTMSVNCQGNVREFQVECSVATLKMETQGSVWSAIRAPSQYKDRLSQVWGFPC